MPLNPLPRNLHREASRGLDPYQQFVSACLGAVTALENWIATGAPAEDVIAEVQGQISRLRQLLIQAGAQLPPDNAAGA